MAKKFFWANAWLLKKEILLIRSIIWYSSLMRLPNYWGSIKASLWSQKICWIRLFWRIRVFSSNVGILEIRLRKGRRKQIKLLLGSARFLIKKQLFNCKKCKHNNQHLWKSVESWKRKLKVICRRMRQ